METIGIKRLMDRLLDNPNLKQLKATSVAAYVKDMISIAGLSTILIPKFIYLKIVDGRGVLPTECTRVTDVFMCEGEFDLPAEYFDKGRMGYSNDSAMIREGIDKRNLGSYRLNHDVIYTDQEELILEVHYEAMAVDSYGFPTFPYDGSLMQAMENYVKYRYYTILGEIGQVPHTAASKSHREYMWYIGQYTSKSDMLTHDEAVAFAHSWQRLVDTRNEDTSTDGLREHLNL